MQGETMEHWKHCSVVDKDKMQSYHALEDTSKIAE